MPRRKVIQPKPSMFMYSKTMMNPKPSKSLHIKMYTPPKLSYVFGAEDRLYRLKESSFQQKNFIPSYYFSERRPMASEVRSHPQSLHSFYGEQCPIIPIRIAEKGKAGAAPITCRHRLAAESRHDIKQPVTPYYLTLKSPMHPIGASQMNIQTTNNDTKVRTRYNEPPNILSSLANDVRKSEFYSKSRVLLLKSSQNWTKHKKLRGSDNVKCHKSISTNYMFAPGDGPSDTNFASNIDMISLVSSKPIHLSEVWDKKDPDTPISTHGDGDIPNKVRIGIVEPIKECQVNLKNTNKKESKSSKIQSSDLTSITTVQPISTPVSSSSAIRERKKVNFEAPKKPWNGHVKPQKRQNSSKIPIQITKNPANAPLVIANSEKASSGSEKININKTGQRIRIVEKNVRIAPTKDTQKKTMSIEKPVQSPPNKVKRVDLGTAEKETFIEEDILTLLPVVTPKRTKKVHIVREPKVWNTRRGKTSLVWQSTPKRTTGGQVNEKFIPDAEVKPAKNSTDSNIKNSNPRENIRRPRKYSKSQEVRETKKQPPQIMQQEVENDKKKSIENTTNTIVEQKINENNEVAEFLKVDKGNLSHRSKLEIHIAWSQQEGDQAETEAEAEAEAEASHETGSNENSAHELKIGTDVVLSLFGEIVPKQSTNIVKSTLKGKQSITNNLNRKHHSTVTHARTIEGTRTANEYCFRGGQSPVKFVHEQPKADYSQLQLALVASKGSKARSSQQNQCRRRVKQGGRKKRRSNSLDLAKIVDTELQNIEQVWRKELRKDIVRRKSLCENLQKEPSQNLRDPFAHFQKINNNVQKMECAKVINTHPANLVKGKKTKLKDRLLNEDKKQFEALKRNIPVKPCLNGIPREFHPCKHKMINKDELIMSAGKIATTDLPGWLGVLRDHKQYRHHLVNKGNLLHDKDTSIGIPLCQCPFKNTDNKPQMLPSFQLDPTKVIAGKLLQQYK